MSDLDAGPGAFADLEGLLVDGFGVHLEVGVGDPLPRDPYTALFDLAAPLFVRRHEPRDCQQARQPHRELGSGDRTGRDF